MKPSSLLLTIVATLLYCSTYAQNMTFLPEKPAPGDKVKLTYNLADSPLEGQQDLEIIAYLFEGDQPKGLDVMLLEQDGQLVGDVQTTSQTVAIAFSVKNKTNNKADDGGGKGFKVLCFDPAADQAVPGAYMAKARMYTNYYRELNIDRNYEKAFNLVKQEFKSHPSSKAIAKNYQFYCYLANKQMNHEAIAEVTAEMTRLAKLKKATEEQLQLAYDMALVLDDKETTGQLKEKILEKFPKGKLAQKEMHEKFWAENELEQKVANLEAYQKKFGDQEGAQIDINFFAASIAALYAKDKNWEKFDYYLNLIADPVRKAGVLNNIAWELSGESLEAEAPLAKKGAQLSKLSLELLEAEMETLSAKPDILSPNRWRENLKYSYAMYADTYALCAYHSGDVETALKFQQIACDQNKFSDITMNERYVVFYEKINGGEKTEALLSSLIADGAASDAMKEQHKQLFVANNTLESAYAKYLQELEKAALEKMRAKIKKEMIKEVAPSFELVNLNGEKVSLSSLQGKIVVVDFWATWCGPCKASFPGMQMALDKYKDRDDVAFVFIDTWERVEDKEKNAADFIDSNGYSFNVLMDNDNSVVTAFKVSGIPTKFILDKKGNIRFKTIGYGGNNDELVQELDMMIQMAGGGNTDSISSAP